MAFGRGTARCCGGTPQAANGTANITTPVAHGNQVFYTSGYGTGAGLVSLRAQNGELVAQETYFTRGMQNHHGGVVLVDGTIYGFSNAILPRPTRSCGRRSDRRRRAARRRGRARDAAALEGARIDLVERDAATGDFRLLVALVAGPRQLIARRRSIMPIRSSRRRVPRADRAAWPLRSSADATSRAAASRESVVDLRGVTFEHRRLASLSRRAPPHARCATRSCAADRQTCDTSSTDGPL